MSFEDSMREHDVLKDMFGDAFTHAVEVAVNATVIAVGIAYDRMPECGPPVMGEAEPGACVQPPVVHVPPESVLGWILDFMFPPLPAPPVAPPPANTFTVSLEDLATMMGKVLLIVLKLIFWLLGRVQRWQEAAGRLAATRAARLMNELRRLS
jgi:hypothetical protein